MGSGVLFEESTWTLLCGDHFTHLGDGPVVTEEDLVAPSMDAEALFRSTCLAPGTAAVMWKLGDLGPTTLALMHGSPFRGDGSGALHDLTDAHEAQYPA